MHPVRGMHRADWRGQAAQPTRLTARMMAAEADPSSQPEVSGLHIKPFAILYFAVQDNGPKVRCSL